MATTNLHTTKEWEAQKPAVVCFEHFYYTKGKVTKVTGNYHCKKKITKSNKIVDAFVNCYWDGYGQCYVKDKRKRDYDIHFTNNNKEKS